jgi:hypothetical protein
MQHIMVEHFKQHTYRYNISQQALINQQGWKNRHLPPLPFFGIESKLNTQNMKLQLLIWMINYT